MKKTVALILALCFVLATYGVSFAETRTQIAFTINSVVETDTGAIIGISCNKSVFPSEIPANTKIVFVSYSENGINNIEMRDFTENIMYFNIAKEVDKITFFAWDFTTLVPLVDSYSLGINLDSSDSEESDPEENDQTTEEIKGIVSGTYLTGLDAATVDLGQNEIMIGTGEDKQTYELTNELRDSLDFEDLIGKNVVAYYDKFDRQINKINQRNNTTTVIKEQDVISISGDTVKYYNENWKSESVSLSGYTKIYNGKYYPEADLAANFKNGQIELIEAGGQKIAKITSYEVFVVNSYSKANERFTFKYGKTYDNNNGEGTQGYYQFPSTTATKPVIYVNGVEKDFDSLSLPPYSVVNYMESPRDVAGNKLKKMYITNGAKTGKVTACFDEERIVELDGEVIYLTMDYATYNTGDGGNDEEKAPFELGVTYTYYLDYMGQIAAVKYNPVSLGTYKYGYVSAAGKVGSSYVVDIVSAESGTVTRYTLTKSIKIDGNSVDESAVADTLKTAKGNISNTYTNTSDVAQPVRFEISGTSLKSIDTLDTGAGGTSDNFTKQVNGDADSTVTESSVKQGGTSYKMLSNTTKALYVPDDVTDTSSYSKLDIKVFKNSNTKRVEVFNVGSDKLVPFVIAYGAVNPSHVFTVSSPYMIVTGTSYTGDKMTITGYKNAGTSPTPITVDPEYYKGSAISGGIDNYDDENDGVKKGDLIRYIQNGSNVVAIEILYNASNPTQKADTSGRIKNLKASGDSTSKYFYYGMVYAASTESKLVALSKYIPSDSVSVDDKDNPDNATYFDCGSSKIYELNSNGDVAYLELLPTLTSYNKESNTASIAIMLTDDNNDWSRANIVYIINN